MRELNYSTPPRHVREILGAPVYEALDLGECAELHAALERLMAEAVGGTPRSSLRPPMVICGQSYEALPDFLLDPYEVRRWLDGEMAGGGGAGPIEGVRRSLEEGAPLVLTRRAAQALIAVTGESMVARTALAELTVIVERMAEKGVV